LSFSGSGSSSSPKGDIGFGVFLQHKDKDTKRTVEMEMAKQVDNLFGKRYADSDEWLMTLRSAAAAAVPPGPGLRRLESAESFSRTGSIYSSSNSNSSYYGGRGTPLPLPNQLDFTILREVRLTPRTLLLIQPQKA